MLTVDTLNFSYTNRPILENISFSLNRGELCGLFGPNGCGKTTLFKCCLKFLTGYKGAISINGMDIKSIKTREMAKLVAYVPQDHKPPFPYLVKEMVLMGRTPHLNGLSVPKARDIEKAEKALSTLGIAHLGDQPYDLLSGGQRQMVLIARAIAQETRLIFLDEPTSALDFKNQLEIWKTLRTIADQGITILACSHDPNHVAWFCDTTVVLNDAEVAATGSPATVLCQEMMDNIYQGSCQVRDLEDIKMILPKNITHKRLAREEIMV
ncbi:MAG: ABC transporter ATP-binding protein [Desulfobacteraceae bacterium]|nr:ABC transporter ATP-binding protein [Desulfobacteraceae bacterium]